MRLLMISLDAAFQADAKTLLAMPHLGALANRGVFCDSVQTIYPSITYPAHVSILTGCYPERHGVSHNEKYFSDLPPQNRPWNWNAEEIKTETLYQAASRAGREVASIYGLSAGIIRLYDTICRKFTLCRVKTRRLKSYVTAAFGGF